MAITRAKKQVHLSYCKTRFRFNNFVANEPSRFLNEIDSKCLEKLNHSNNKNNLSIKPNLRRKSNSELKFNIPKKLIKIPNFKHQVVNSQKQNLEIGQSIKHNIFGKGEIIAMEGETPNVKATVTFQGAGNKQLLLKFAKLRIVGKAKQ